MWARFYIINNFYRALIGNNNSKFKNYFGEFIPIPIEKLLDQEKTIKPIDQEQVNFSQTGSKLKLLAKNTTDKKNTNSRNSEITTPRKENTPDSPLKKMGGNLKYLSSMTDAAFGLMQSTMNATSPIGNRNPFVIEYYYLIDRTFY